VPHKSLDLFVSNIFTLLLLIATWITINEQVQLPRWLIPVAIPVVLFFPGYAIIMAILPKLERVTSLLYALGLSICVLVCSGFILNVTPWGLQPGSWAIWLSFIIFLANGVAWFRRRTISDEVSLPLPKLKLHQIFGFGLALIILSAAVMISGYSTNLRDKPFTQLWAIPFHVPDDGYGLKIGIENQTTETRIYDVYVESNGKRLEEWQTITLGPGDKWTASIKLQALPSQPIRIFLYLTKNPNSVYRMAQIAPEAFTQISTPIDNKP
jgi:hypothetical protein